MPPPAEMMCEIRSQVVPGDACKMAGVNSYASGCPLVIRPLETDGYARREGLRLDSVGRVHVCAPMKRSKHIFHEHQFDKAYKKPIYRERKESAPS